LKIEQPSPTGDPPEGDNYETIGQFYEAIKRGFRELFATLGDANIFCGHPARQVFDQYFYHGCGRVIAIDNLANALAALEEIVEQGEGAPQMPGFAIGAMYTLKAQAQALMQTPTEDGLATAGPTFEYVASDRRAVRSQSAGERRAG